MLRRQFAASSLALLAASNASAQGGKVSKIVVGFPAGQGIDLVARIVAEALKTELGETVIVENKPGQGGSIALGQVARAAPDGTTILISAMAALVTAPHLYKNVAKVCAAAIVAKLAGREPVEPRLLNTCYSIVGPDYGITVAGVYRPDKGQLVDVAGAGGVSPLDADASFRAQEALYAEGWFRTITAETFG